MHRPTRGFTLVEVVVSLFMLGVAMLMFVAVGVLIQNANGIKHANIALTIAHTKLDTIRADGQVAMPTSGPFTDPLLFKLPNGTASTTITNYSASVKEVLVGVSWTTNTSNERYISLTTLITDVGGL